MLYSNPGVAAAAEQNKHLAAVRAVDDPVKLARAARIVREALARDKITVEELLPHDQAVTP
jgi:hypothetical protein